MSQLIFGAFFLVVLVVAVRCNKVIAYSTGLLAAASYGLLLWSTTHLLLEPFLLLVCSVLVSDLLCAQRRQFLAALEQQQLVDQKLAKAQSSYQAALLINTDLEQQIAGQTLSIATISDRLAQIWKLHTDERYSAIVNLVGYALEASSCALYIQRDRQMRLYAVHPEASTHSSHSLHFSRDSVLELTHPLIRRVMESRQVSTVRDVLAEENTVEQDMPVMAGPLLDGVGHIMGILVIESLPLLKFTPGTIRLFSSILLLVSLALQTSFSTRGDGSNDFINRITTWEIEEDSAFKLQGMV